MVESEQKGESTIKGYPNCRDSDIMGVMEDRLNQVMETMGELGRQDPQVMQSFGAFVEGAMKDGNLNRKTKELISLGMSITARCKYCITMHVKGALDAGATREEIIETCYLAIMMGGGPALTHVVEVMDSLRECQLEEE